MTKLLLGAAFAVLSAAPAFAGSTSFTDQTLDFAFLSGGGQTSYSAPGFVGPTTGDHIGTDFDTEKLVVTMGSGTLHLQYYTNFGGSDLGAHYADIFLAPTNSLTGAPSAWTYGLALGIPGSGDNFQDAVAQGLYSLTGGASDYMTSQQIWGLKSGYIYGGGYVAPGEPADGSGPVNLSPTRVTDTDPAGLLSGWTLTAQTLSNTGPDGASYPTILDVVLSAPGDSQAIFESVFDQPDLDIFWGTGDCANDALFAAVDAPVPEPISLSLFGAGLAGAFAYGRRKKKTG